MTSTIIHMQQLSAHLPVKVEVLVQDLAYVSVH